MSEKRTLQDMLNDPPKLEVTRACDKQSHRRAAPHKIRVRIRLEELRHRKARLERNGKRPCPVCGHAIYGRGDTHPQCAFFREESSPPR